MVAEAKNRLVKMWFDNRYSFEVPFMVIATNRLREDRLMGRSCFVQEVVVVGLKQEDLRRTAVETAVFEPLQPASVLVAEVFRHDAGHDEDGEYAYCEAILLTEHEDVTVSEAGRKIIEKWENQPAEFALVCPQCKDLTTDVKERKGRWEGWCPKCRFAFKRPFGMT